MCGHGAWLTWADGRAGTSNPAAERLVVITCYSFNSSLKP